MNTDSITWPLYPDDIPNNIKLQDEVTEVRNTGWRFVTAVSVPELTYFQPTEPKGKAVVVCPGGGYRGLSVDKEGFMVCRRLQEAGYHAFMLKYRTPAEGFYEDPSVAPLEDAAQALQLATKVLEDNGFKEVVIGIMGFSAGGHLAATAANKLDYQFSALIYPVITLEEPHLHRGSRKNLLGKEAPEEKAIDFSADKMVNEHTPPAFLVHATDDKAVPVKNSLLYYEACLKYNISAEMHIYKAGGHGFGMVNPTTPDLWMDRFLNWVE